METQQSNKQWDEVVSNCKAEFSNAFDKYGNSLAAYDDPIDILSKVFIKLFRIKSIQVAGKYHVEGENIEKEIPGIINYCIYGVLATKRLLSGTVMPAEKEELLAAYDKASASIKELFEKKNHDYGEAWRKLSVSYMTKECLAKYDRMTTVYSALKFKKDDRLKLEKNFVEVFSDICNYQIFCAIRIFDSCRYQKILQQNSFRV